MGIIKAKNKPISVWGKSDLTAEDERLGLTGSPTKAGAVFTPDMKRKSEMLTGSVEEMVDRVIEKLRAAGVNVPTKDDACSIEGGAQK
jgi:electron transfer flavoprotein beta subunit